MIRAALALALLAGCAPKPVPVVTSGGTSEDGRHAWFAVTRGAELTIYHCEGEGCWVVPRADEPARRMPSAPPPEVVEDASDDEADADDDDERENEEGPEEERLDMMDGVL